MQLHQELRGLIFGVHVTPETITIINLIVIAPDRNTSRWTLVQRPKVRVAAWTRWLIRKCRGWLNSSLGICTSAHADAAANVEM